MNLRNAFNRGESKPTKIEGESLTMQHMKDETDINHIVNRYYKTRDVRLLNPQNRQAIFGDFTELDFHKMSNAVFDVEEAFARLPAKLRRRFDESPLKVLRFTDDPVNRAEALKLGLVVPTEEELEAMSKDMPPPVGQPPKEAPEAPKPPSP